MSISQHFLEHSIDFLANHYEAKILRCVESLDDRQIWWRPHEEANSIGNLILHLSGNIRQWIVSGLGGKADQRRRQEEFDERRMIPRVDLLEVFKKTIGEAVEVLRAIEPSALTEQREIQGKKVSVLYAIYHVVEHCSMHTGQIIHITKELTGKDMQFYGFEKGKPIERWKLREGSKD